VISSCRTQTQTKHNAKDVGLLKHSIDTAHSYKLDTQVATHKSVLYRNGLTDQADFCKKAILSLWYTL